MTRMGDGFPVEMTEKKLMGDLVEGTEDAAEYGRIPALSKEELQYLFDLFMAPYRFVGVEPGGWHTAPVPGARGDPCHGWIRPHLFLLHFRTYLHW